MLQQQNLNDRISVLVLLERLIDVLNAVFDAHGVCAAAAHLIANHTSTATIVSISDPVGKHNDVWICDEEGRMKQDRWGANEAFLERIYQTESVAIYEKDQTSTQELSRSELWQLAHESILAVPLPFPVGSGQITLPGMLCLLDPGIDCLLKPDNLSLIASQLTVFLDRALLRQRSAQQEVEFGIISDISHSLTSTLNLEEIISQVTDAVRRVLGAESLTIGLTDPSGTEIVFVEALMGPAFRHMPPVSFKIGQGIAGWVALHGKPAIVNNAYEDNRFSTKVDRDTGFLTNSVLCVPLKIEQRVIGVMEAINKANGNFDENDSRVLQAISGPLAVAIENALLHAQALAEKRRIETIFSSMSEGLLTCHRDGSISTANDALLSLLGIDGGDIGDQKASEIIRTYPTGFAEFFQQVLEGKNDFPQLACDVQQGSNESVPVLISGATIDQGKGEVDELIFVFSDLRQVREVERMRDDFFHNIVHELRTPLATILMYARLLREGKAVNDPPKANRFLGVIERESDRLQKMVRQMLQLAKLEAGIIEGKDELASLNSVFEQVLPPLAERASQKGLVFEYNIQPDLPPVMGSMENIYMVIKNLVENAVIFTPSGSVTVDAWLDQDLVKIHVADEGIGIPKEAIPNLFRRFYRAQNTVERGIAGTGLGLYMVKEGLESYGGSIEVESQEGQGTKFSVVIPIANNQLSFEPSG